MARHLKLISEIRPEDKKWSTKIIVAEKGMPKVSRYNLKKYQSLLLCDTQGTKIQATIFDRDIERFEDTLKPLGKYYISNANVKPSRPQYRIVDNEYEWIINKYAFIEQVPEEEDVFEMFPLFHFTTFANFQQEMDRSTSIDVIAIAVDVRPKKQAQTKNGSQEIQEAILVNQEKIPIVLTFWDQFVTTECAAISEIINTRPIIAAIRLKVVSFNGLSLSTKISSSFIINPSIPEAHILRAWSDQNETYLQDIVTKKLSDHACTSILATPPHDLITNINLIEPEMQKTCWIKASVSLINKRQRFWYMACNNCQKVTRANFDQPFKCYDCKKPNAKAAPRYCVNVELRDSTGVLQAMLFGENAEKFLGCSAYKLMKTTLERGLDNMDELINISSSEDYIICVKIMKNNTDSATQFRFVVHSMSNTVYSDAKNPPEQEIEFFDASSASMDTTSAASNDPVDISSEITNYE